MPVQVVGIDCATVDAKVGLARGFFDDDQHVKVEEATLCTRDLSAAKRVADWIRGAEIPVLIAIDAPLGWPAPMAKALATHRAGSALGVEPNEMFRRRTDRVIQETLRKTPLDVGADRIARTAHAALKLLGEIAHLARISPIPLAWNSTISGVSAIEVYPAATLIAHGIPSSGYKALTQTSKREDILTALRSEIDVDASCVGLDVSADMLDAVVCALAAKDFLQGRASPPMDLALAQQEGWIWVSSSRA
jgi:predicted nuclease with RNAse H fold